MMMRFFFSTKSSSALKKSLPLFSEGREKKTKSGAAFLSRIRIQTCFVVTSSSRKHKSVLREVDYYKSSVF